MNALVLHSPRGLAKPTTQIVRRAPADSIVVTPLLGAIARAYGCVTALAARVHDLAAAQERTSRWVSSRQIESPELPAQFELPEPQSGPTTFKVRRSSLLDIWD
jgi:hypothetical protein